MPLTGRIAGRPLHPQAPTGARTPEGVEAVALNWFAQMRSGKIDRSQLAPEYDAHLTDHAVEQMSRYLKAYEFAPCRSRPMSCRPVRVGRRGSMW
jgi:ferric-dicitrate binding protein FerR (iron transport regulator)